MGAGKERRQRVGGLIFYLGAPELFLIKQYKSEWVNMEQLRKIFFGE